MTMLMVILMMKMLIVNYDNDDTGGLTVDGIQKMTYNDDTDGLAVVEIRR